MIQIVAKLRRVAACSAVLASVSVFTAGASRAQSPPPPPADTTAKPAAADTTAKPASQPGSQPVPAPAAGTPAAATAPASKAQPSSAAKSQKSATSKPSKTSKSKASKAAAAGATTAAVAKAHGEPRKLESPYGKGANWLSLRFGYANRTGELSGDGYVGYGIGYSHMLNKRYAFAAGINHDVVGHFAKQIDESVNYTGEFERVFNWSGEMRPYLGLGGGFYLRKMYRTGTDYSTTTTGGAHVSLGLTSQLDEKHVIGFETRVAWVKGRPGVVNPTFGPGTDTETIYTAKLTWALVY